MKKILLITCYLFSFPGLYAQTGSVTVINNSSCSNYIVSLLAESTDMGTTGCGDIHATSFYISAGCTYYWADPYAIETSTSYCISGSCPASTPAIGWSLLPGSYISVCGSSCPGGGLWSGTYPSDWFWSKVEIDVNTCTCVVGGSLGAAACGGSASISGCGTSNATISYSSTAPLNITVTINP